MAIAIGDDLQHNDSRATRRPYAPPRPARFDANDRQRDIGARERLARPPTKWMWIGFVTLSVLMVAYLISLLVRTPDQQWTWLDGWSVCAIEAVASFMCIARGLNKHPGRSAPLALGFALLSWTIG